MSSALGVRTQMRKDQVRALLDFAQNHNLSFEAALLRNLYNRMEQEGCFYLKGCQVGSKKDRKIVQSLRRRFLGH